MQLSKYVVKRLPTSLTCLHITQLHQDKDDQEHIYINMPKQYHLSLEIGNAYQMHDIRSKKMILKLLGSTFQVQTTFPCPTAFLPKRLVIGRLQDSVNGIFPTLLLLKKCSLNKKSYVFSKFCSHIERFRSENSFLQGLT